MERRCVDEEIGALGQRAVDRDAIARATHSGQGTAVTDSARDFAERITGRHQRKSPRAGEPRDARELGVDRARIEQHDNLGTCDRVVHCRVVSKHDRPGIHATCSKRIE